MVSSSFMYNLWSVPLRITFPYQDDSNIYLWLIADYVADVIYLVDTFLIRPRLRFVREGSWIEEVTDCRKNYIASLGSKVVKDIFKFNFSVVIDLLLANFLDRCIISNPIRFSILLFWSSKFTSSLPSND